MLLFKIGTNTINTFLPTRNKFVYSSSIKIHASVFDELLESIFCFLLVVEAYSLQNIIKMLEEVVVSWWEVRWTWQMRQNLLGQFIQLLKCWLWDDIWLGIVAEKNLAFSVDQCQLQALPFWVHLIDLLRVLLRYNRFLGDSESCSGSEGQQTTCSDRDFSLVQVWLCEVLCSFFLVQPWTCW